MVVDNKQVQRVYVDQDLAKSSALRHVQFTLDTRTKLTIFFMPHCPRCGKRCKSDEKVIRHLNQPRSSCANLIDDLISISAPFDDFRPGQAEDSDEDSDTESFAGDGITEGVTDDINMDQQDFDIAMGQQDLGFVDNEEGSAYREEYPTAARVWGKGETFMEKFNQDRFAHEREKNMYYPFASKDDWEMASFLLRSGLSMALIDDFLSLQLVHATLVAITSIN